MDAATHEIGTLRRFCNVSAASITLPLHRPSCPGRKQTGESGGRKFACEFVLTPTVHHHGMVLPVSPVPPIAVVPRSRSSDYRHAPLTRCLCNGDLALVLVFSLLQNCTPRSPCTSQVGMVSLSVGCPQWCASYPAELPEVIKSRPRTLQHFY